MSPPRSATQRPAPLVRQLSLQQIPLGPVPPAGQPPSSARRGLLRRQRSAEDDRPVTRLLHSALRVTASALGPGFLADTSPPPDPPPPPPKPNKLRPVRVAWAELRKATPEAAEAVAVVAQKVGLSRPNNNARPPTCLPALARANLDIFLAHSGLAQCITSTLTSDPPASPVSDNLIKRPSTPCNNLTSPREPIKPPFSPLPNRPTLPPQTTTQPRRVNFRNAALRVINRGLTDSSVSEPRPPLPESRTFRVLSAPAHRPASLAVPPRPLLRSLSRRGPLQAFIDSSERLHSDQVTQNVPGERIRSAPPRRRLKAGSATRKKGSSRRGEESSGDDEEIEEAAGPVMYPPRPCSSAGPMRGRRGLRSGAEIVTMVSLVSPTVSSDSEDERSPRLLATPSPTALTGSPASQNDDLCKSMAAISSVIVCARKITKSVSFQTRGSVPEVVRRAPSTQQAVTPSSSPSSTVTTAPQKSAEVKEEPQKVPEESTKPPEPPQPAEEKPKKKLLRTKSSFLRHESELRAIEKALIATGHTSSLTSAETPAGLKESVNDSREKAPEVIVPPAAIVQRMISDPSVACTPENAMETQSCDDCDQDGTPRPHFETPKEKECWQLYRKMCEKGLTVSFDTVLRGMLTPTEYRMRRGALLSTC